MSNPDTTQPDDDTVAADEKAAHAGKDAGAEPTPDEEAAAERAAENAPDIEGDYRDMTEKGAHAKGEGAVD